MGFLILDDAGWMEHIGGMMQWMYWVVKEKEEEKRHDELEKVMVALKEGILKKGDLEICDEG